MKRVFKPLVVGIGLVGLMFLFFSILNIITVDILGIEIWHNISTLILISGVSSSAILADMYFDLKDGLSDDRN